MDIIQYLYGTNWLPAAVTAQTIRKYSGIENPKFTLYTTDGRVLTNPYLQQVFDVIEYPDHFDWLSIWQTDWNMWKAHPSHIGNDAYPEQFRKYCLIKLACFLYHPRPCLLTDGDLLCLGDCTELQFYLEGGYKWAGRINGPDRGGYHHVNGGVLLKNEAFDPEPFTRPLYDIFSFAECMNLTKLDDEAILLWAQAKYGPMGFRELDPRYNAYVQKQRDITDPRLVHFCCKDKPWLDVNEADLSEIGDYYAIWRREATELLNWVNYVNKGTYKLPYDISVLWRKTD